MRKKERALHTLPLVTGAAVFVLAAFGALTGTVFCGHRAYGAEKGSLYAGTAKVVITPSTPIPMSGYGGRKGPFKGVHDDIYARAIAFDDGTTKSVIISAEVIGFSHDFWSAATATIEKETGIAPDHILLTAVHNHGGPVTMVYNREPAPEVVAYRDELQAKIVGAVRTALGSMQPVTIGAGKGECLMNINRRSHDPEHGVTLGRNPYGPCDHEVGVVRIDGPGGKPVAVIVNWACHGTVFGPRNYLITGDWPGAAARYIEKKIGGDCISLMIIGASGDINPIYGPHIDFEDVRSYAYGAGEIGMVLGDESARVADSIRMRKGGTITATQRIIELPKKKDTSNLQQPEIGSDTTVGLRLTVLKVGDIVFAGVSGEVFTEIGMQMKSGSPFTNTYMVTHCNGSSGYFITDKAYIEGGYEASSTRAESGAEKAIVDSLLDMINGL